MERIRILIADDHPIVRKGIRSLLTQYGDLDVAGEAGTGPAVLEQVAQLQPNVVLLGVRMAGANGIEIARQLRRQHPETRVIILTTYDDEEYLFAALQVGAHAYLLKDVSLDTLPAAIRAVHQGERLLSPLLVDNVLREFQSLATEKLRRIVQEVMVEIPRQDRPGRPISRVFCARCGEGINDQREVQINGQILCRACAYGSYYRVASRASHRMNSTAATGNVLKHVALR